MTLRPTKTTHLELYDLENIAKFSSEFFKYEILDNVLHPPEHVVSPTSTIGWQIGDSFDIAMVTVSLLLGTGYDAYVVIGYAPKDIVFNDQSHTILKIEEDNNKDISTSTFNNNTHLINNDVKNYIIKEKKEIEFLKEDLINYIHDDNDTCNSKESMTSDENEDYESDDRESEMGTEKNKCVHAWVLIVPALRDVVEMKFLEPSTGTIYGVKDSPYEGIEFIFNHKNYWICQQMPGLHSDARADPKSISYDLNDTDKWEPVFKTKDDIITSIHKHLHLKSSYFDEYDISTTTSLNSWVCKLNISREVLNMRCPRVV